MTYETARPRALQSSFSEYLFTSALQSIRWALAARAAVDRQLARRQPLDAQAVARIFAEADRASARA